MIEVEQRVSLRGRTLWGYANWSLNGGNRIRINANTIWWETRDEDMFAYMFAATVAHEVLHILLHQVRDLRRGGRFTEADRHHVFLRPFDDWIRRDCPGWTF